MQITNYKYLLETMFGAKDVAIGSKLKLSDLSGRSAQAQLRAAGIDTSSPQYKAALNLMMKGAGGRPAYVNIQGIKNLMNSFDAKGNYIIKEGPFAGITGLEVNDENASKRTKGYIPIADSAKQEMFELVKEEFLTGKRKGIDTISPTDRSNVYANMYRKTAENDRLAAGRTLQEYEKHYRESFKAAAEAADPAWEWGIRPSKTVADAIRSVERADFDKTISLAMEKPIDFFA